MHAWDGARCVGEVAMTDDARLTRPRPRWSRAWRAESRRMLSLRSQLVLLLVAFASALIIGIAQVVALPAGVGPDRIVKAVVSGVEISPFFIGLAATLFAAADLASRQFALTLLQLNNRVVVFGVKVTVLVASAVLSGLVVIAVVLPFAMTLRGSLPGPSALSLFALPALHVLFAILGAAIGMIARSVTAAVFIYLAVVWALPLTVAVVGIWAPSISGPILQLAPVTLTAAMLEPGSRAAAVLRFGAMDAVLLVVGGIRVLGWRIR